VLLHRGASHDVIQKVGDGKAGHGGTVCDVCFTIKGKAFVTACADALIRIWQVGTGNVIRVLRGHSSAVTGVCFSPLDGRIVCRCVASFPLCKTATIRFDNIPALSNCDILHSVGSDCSARVWRVDNGLMLKNLGSYDAAARHNSWVLCVRFSPDGKIIATAGADCSVRLWSVETARLVVKLEGFRGWVRALAWTNDGSRLAAACNDCDVCVARFPSVFL
jgi:WD40 repeat protein